MANLGTLTVDLVARTAGFVQGMDAAGRESQKLRRRVQKDFEVVGRAVGLGIGAATTALTGLVVQTTASAKEIQRFSAIAQSSNAEFQRFAAASDKVGISQEKLADIFKDVNDRVGDFLVTGGGPLADFFETVAPKIGVTADQLRNLSGPQALQFLVKSLQDAGANSQEFTFFLESIASDATALAPLLVNNAELLREFGDQADRAGSILSDDLITSALAFDAISQDIRRAVQGFSLDVAESLLPALVAVGEAFKDARVQADTLGGSTTSLGEKLLTLAQATTVVQGGFAIAGRTIGGTLALINAVRNGGSIEGVREVINAFGEDLDAVQSRYSQILGDLQDAKNDDSGDAFGGLGDDAQSAAERLAELQSTIRGQLGLGVGLNTGTDSDPAGIESTIKGLEDQVATLGKSADAIEDYKLQIAGATPEQRALAAQLRETITTFEAGEEALEEFNKRQEETNEQARAIEQSLRTQEEAIRDSYERRRDIILRNTEITGQARERLLLRLEQNTNDQLAEINQSFWQNYADQIESSLQNLDQVAANTISGFASDFGSVVEGIVFDAESLDDALFRLFDGFARAGINALAELGAQWLIYQLIVKGSQSAAQASAATTISANAAAQQQLAALNAFASTAAIPITGPALAPAAAAAALTATAPFVIGATTAAFSGVAHDGLMSVPQTGTYLLEKGERVTTADTSAKLDQKLDSMGSGGVRIINSIDPSLITDYMGSSAGEKVIMNTIRKNQRTVSALASA